MKIADAMRLTKGKSSGFDYLRVLLAISVIGFHSVIICYGKPAQERLHEMTWGLPFGFTVPMFFALSGFLVAGSLLRSKNIGIFIGLRIFRILPALLVDTLFCALVIGVLFTSRSLINYLDDPRFHHYFLNFTGDIHYHLPGVFSFNPSSKVNGQLWTIPWQLEGYGCLALLGLLGIHRSRVTFGALIVLALVTLEARLLITGGDAWRDPMMCFLAGVMLFLWREHIELKWSYFIVGIIVSGLAVVVPELGYFLPIPMAYVTVFLGLSNMPRVGLIKRADYSYGIYLYGWPLQQILVSTIPIARIWWVNILMGVPLAVLFAGLSWHLVEKPVQARKKILDRILPWIQPDWGLDRFWPFLFQHRWFGSMRAMWSPPHEGP